MKLEGKKQRERQCPPKGGIRKLLRRLPALLPHNKEGKVQRKSIRHSFKNAQQLTIVGIRFKPNETGHLGDISFTSDCSGITGCLRLPPITIDTSTMIIFLNLIAFESSNTPNDLGVISYLCFLDSLIDHWDDVKELQAAQVLHNFLGDQREVAKFFNHVCGKLDYSLLLFKPTLHLPEADKLLLSILLSPPCQAPLARVRSDDYVREWSSLRFCLGCYLDIISL
ncbi:uncharacterized protein LOC104880181 isoform X2 [Vitis vinifera]|uniref:uncharacterized protein LOC104880181 isoform X2 n=1 Tax=Vitis vinifera TaxID=29760 RepID=UPI002883320B|nr:uncharacterized protein LOC104880181 isoform X2 [Vitis vinifera]